MAEGDEIKDEIRKIRGMALRNMQRVYDQQIAKHSTAIIVNGNTGTIVYATLELNELFGYENVEGKNVTDLMPERFRSRHVEHLRHYMDFPDKRVMGEREMNLFGLHADGNEFPIAISLIPLLEFIDGQYVIAQIMKTKN